MISKIIVEILCKYISYVCFYIELISYVLYCLGDGKVRISKITLEILLKSKSYVFYYFKSNSYVFYCLHEKMMKKWGFQKSFLKFY